MRHRIGREQVGGGIVTSSSTKPDEATTIIAPATTITAASVTTAPTRPERWTALPAAPATPGLGTTATWTGRELIVVGGMPTGRVEETAMTTEAAAYDPAGNRWQAIAVAPPRRRERHGSLDRPRDGRVGRAPLLGGNRRRSGLRPRRRPGRILPPAPIDGRWSSTVTWTGTEIVIWGGNGGRTDRKDGAAYDPGANRLRRLAPSPLGRRIARATWTGTKLLIFGGTADGDGEAGPATDGAAYDPAADRWRPISPPNAAAAVAEATPQAWTGQEMLVAGRQGGRARWVAYRPDSDRWRVLLAPPAPDTWIPVTEWTGSDLLAWAAVFNCRGDCTQSATGQAPDSVPSLRRSGSLNSGAHDPSQRRGSLLDRPAHD